MVVGPAAVVVVARDVVVGRVVVVAVVVVVGRTVVVVVATVVVGRPVVLVGPTVVEVGGTLVAGGVGPPQGAPSIVHAVGGELVPPRASSKPKVVLCPTASTPFQDALATLT